MTPLVEVVLKKIDIRKNTSNFAGHPSDESFAKYLLKWLHQHNEVLNAEEIIQWAIKHNWSEKQAKDIGDWTRDIDEEHQVVIQFIPYFPDNYFTDLLAEAKKNQL
ncbi:DUF1889 family protein [Acinetobacter sp. ANC 3832]|uniref:DUF1889 family protein n=1 Tax=Acinetobacter sp. ANC 3832 TaxID=1977874 RepID=UPI000A32B946|nr:DUF1889 family protein [Acinetobacter sp. ANC 3832]OTG95007.1 hypothetical protein B9T35_06505 [Acinetobacter sp. ANC 3832]